MDRFEIPLDIEDVKIEAVEFTPTNEIMITVTSTVEGTHCHCCGKKITATYGCGREITAASFTDFREADVYSD